ncbi:MAG: sensor histidine kinase [Flavobacteriales bacterium]|nr:sensor histidine kinase [Flavobacteriales bacterium]
MRWRFAALFFFSVSCSSGQDRLDSLFRVLRDQRGLDRIKTLGEVEWDLSLTEPLKALGYGEEAMKMALGLGDSAAVAFAANDMAICAHRASRFALAVALNTRALRIRYALLDSVGVAASHAKLSTAYTEMQRMDSALVHGFAAAELYEHLHDPQRSAQVRGNLARIYQLQRNFLMAERAGLKAVELLEGTDNIYAQAAACGQLGSVQIDLKKYKEAHMNSLRAMEYFQRIGALNDAGVAANQLGIICRETGKQGEGEQYYRLAMELAERSDDLGAVATYAHNIGNVLHEQGKLKEALASYERSLSLSRVHGFLHTRMNVLDDYSELLEKDGRFADALKVERELAHLRDSVIAAEREQSLEEMQVKYETARTEKELLEERAHVEQQSREIAQQRLRILALGGGSLLLILLGGLVILIVRSRHKAQLNEQVIAERDRGLKAVIDSTEAERRRLAGELHDGVGQQLAGLRFQLEDVATRISDRAPDERSRVAGLMSVLDDAGRDVRGIAHNLRPRALDDLGLAPALGDMLHKALDRPGFTLNYEHFGLEARLPQHVEVGVYRIAQELVNNIIKHADSRSVNVQLLKNKGHLVLMVEDDGKGMGDRTHDGIGLLSMNDRARAMHGHIDFSNAPVNGTIVTLRLPLTNGNSIQHA